MENIDKIVELMKVEQDFLKSIQIKMMDNHQILIDNSQHNFENMEILTKNLGVIINNQEIIVNNQISIINNQKHIVSNQITLSVLLKTQTQMLNLLKKLNGESETIEQTQESILALKEMATQQFNLEILREPKTLNHELILSF
jgi:hypothetical protein